MNKTFALIPLLALGACASTDSAARATAQASFCNPCPMPCQSGCVPFVATAPAPKPPVAAPAPVKAAEPAAAATFDPPSGEYAEPQFVKLSSATPGAVIHYTTDGSAPNAASPVYADPIRVEKSTTIQAIAVAPDAPMSAVSTASYKEAPPPPPPPPARVVVTKERLQLKEVVLFETGKAVIDQRSHSLLDEVAAALKDHPEVKSVRVEGNTDNTGAAKSNMKLSQARAEAVRQYLVDRGVAADRLAAQGFGQTRPVASNKTAAGREANRRVDFVIAQE